MRSLINRARASRVGRAITTFGRNVANRFRRNSAPAEQASSGDS
ncbi:hypothetical protein [Rhodococcus rhodochrous]|nr:hypothetical protein [Rhodococcus rhodochrous]